MFGSPFDTFSTGFVPRSEILQTIPGHGVTGLYDTVRVRHASGGVSTISTRYYTQPRTEWQGATLDILALDEEPPPELLSEGMMRLTGPGIMFCTFTPLKGRTQIVDRFLFEEDPISAADRGVTQMSLDEAEHFTEREKQQRIAAMPAHERDARRYGEPMLGEGAVYESPIASISVDHNLEIPHEWRKIWGIDFGSTVFAAALLAFDADSDVVYVVATVRLEGSRPIEHAAAMRRICPEAPVAWPHDGHSAERGTGEVIINQYRPHGLRLLGTHATHAKGGGYLVEPGVLEIQARMSTGRFRVKAHLADWWDEYRGYHRKGGRIAKPQRDHLMDATRMAVMMLRSARPVPMGAALSPYTKPTSRQKFARGVGFDPFDPRGLNTRHGNR
jgi:phage terminase large subunit-like protein